MKEYSINQLKKIFPKMNFNFLNHPKINYITKKLGNKWFFVGGVVRDGLLGLNTYDIDITTTIKPKVIEEYFKEQFTLNLIGREFGTVAIYAHPYTVEITTTRRDINCDGRWADVCLVQSFEEDSKRRDFTINALLFNNKKLIDYHEGISHLKNNQVIFVGNPVHRMTEDYLRALRFVRFFCRFGSKNNQYYKDEIKGILPHLHSLAKERISSEIVSMINYYAPNNQKKIKGNNLKKVNDSIEMFNNYGFSKELYGKILPKVPSRITNTNDRLAHIFQHIPSKNMGLPKEINILKFLLKPFENPGKRGAEIWKKYKSVELLEKFLFYHQLSWKGLPDLTIDIDLLTLAPKKRGEYILQFWAKKFSESIYISK